MLALLNIICLYNINKYISNSLQWQKEDIIYSNLKLLPIEDMLSLQKRH